MKLSEVLLIAATILSGLIAGLFYSYSCSVMPALKSVNDYQFISAMQSINSAIQNPLFFLSFLGCLILLPIAAYVNYSRAVNIVFRYFMAAILFYFAGVILITFYGNIPLNNALEKVDLINSTKETLSLQRKMFEIPWNNFNTVRSISSILTFICCVLACLNYKKS